MRYDSDDALDRALFGLALEEPPEDLRASILTATVYRPAPAFSAWEIAGLGILTAVAVWFVALIVQGGGTLFVHTVTDIGTVLAHSLTNASTVAWVAAGIATAIWLSVFSGFQPFALAGQRSGRRGSR